MLEDSRVSKTWAQIYMLMLEMPSSSQVTKRIPIYTKQSSVCVDLHAIHTDGIVFLFMLFISTSYKIVPSRKRETQRRNCLHQMGLWTCLRSLSWLMIDMGVGRSQNWLWGSIHVWWFWIIQESKLRMLWKVKRTRPVNSVPSWFLLQFLP